MAEDNYKPKEKLLFSQQQKEAQITKIVEGKMESLTIDREQAIIEKELGSKKPPYRQV